MLSFGLLLVLGATPEPEGATSDGRLNYYAAGVEHPNGCAYHGKWAGSCDVEGVGIEAHIKQPGGWDADCDPHGCDVGGSWTGNCFNGEPNPIKWTGEVAQSDGTWVFEGSEVPSGAEAMPTWSDTRHNETWTCPVEERSPSGCGDFRTDTRGLTCDEEQTLECGWPDNADRREIVLQQPTTVQLHTCVQRPIFFNNGNTAGDIGEERVLPVSIGKHRPRWPAWGEYSFLPPQRWVHSSEHGALVFLYHQCLREEDICKIRRFIAKLKQPGFIPGVTEKQPLRFIMTPFKDLMVKVAIVTWGKMYMSKCWNEELMRDFAADNYRRGWEDWYPPGPYNHLLEDIDANVATCGADPNVGKPCETDEDCAKGELMCKCNGQDRRDLLFARTADVCACASRV